MKWVQNCRGKYCTHIYKCMLNEKIHTICKEILLTLTQLMKQSHNPKMSCD
jgi:hypothetical protein